MICGDKVIYRGTASWFPVGLDRTNKVTLTDPAGNLLFETRFSPIEHFFESAKKKTSG